MCEPENHKLLDLIYSLISCIISIQYFIHSSCITLSLTSIFDIPLSSLSNHIGMRALACDF